MQGRRGGPRPQEIIVRVMPTTSRRPKRLYRLDVYAEDRRARSLVGRPEIPLTDDLGGRRGTPRLNCYEPDRSHPDWPVPRERSAALSRVRGSSKPGRSPSPTRPARRPSDTPTIVPTVDVPAPSFPRMPWQFDRTITRLRVRTRPLAGRRLSTSWICPTLNVANNPKPDTGSPGPSPDRPEKVDPASPARPGREPNRLGRRRACLRRLSRHPGPRPT